MPAVPGTGYIFDAEGNLIPAGGAEDLQNLAASGGYNTPSGLSPTEQLNRFVKSRGGLGVADTSTLQDYWNPQTKRYENQGQVLYNAADMGQFWVPEGDSAFIAAPHHDAPAFASREAVDARTMLGEMPGLAIPLVALGVGAAAAAGAGAGAASGGSAVPAESAATVPGIVDSEAAGGTLAGESSAATATGSAANDVVAQRAAGATEEEAALSGSGQGASPTEGGLAGGESGSQHVASNLPSMSGIGAAAKDVASTVGPAASVLSSLSMINSANKSNAAANRNQASGAQTPTVFPPAVMPVFGGTSTLQSMRRALTEQLQRRGRASTILTSGGGSFV